MEQFLIAIVASVKKGGKVQEMAGHLMERIYVQPETISNTHVMPF